MTSGKADEAYELILKGRYRVLFCTKSCSGADVNCLDLSDLQGQRCRSSLMKAASCGANEAIGALLDRGVRVSLRYFLTRLKVNPDYVDLDNMTGIAWNCFSLPYLLTFVQHLRMQHGMDMWQLSSHYLLRPGDRARINQSLPCRSDDKLLAISMEGSGQPQHVCLTDLHVRAVPFSRSQWRCRDCSNYFWRRKNQASQGSANNA